MKSLNLLVTLSLIFSLVACHTYPEIKDLDTTLPIQAIETYGHNYVYAQDDTLIRDFRKTLSEMNPEWEKDIKRANSYYGGAITSYALSLIGLVGCLATDSDNSSAVVAWCSSTIALSLISIPLFQKGNKYKHKAVKAYNDQY